MENLTQKDPVWRENGKAFVESVTRLLERLLDYRNVGQVSKLSMTVFHDSSSFLTSIMSSNHKNRKEFSTDIGYVLDRFL